MFAAGTGQARVLHVGCPNIGDREAFERRLRDILDRRWLTNNGVYVQEFEQKLCAYLGVRHCIPVCNGTTALEIAIRALGLEGEVILPSFTFIATAHALAWMGIKPVFCDIAQDGYNIDPAEVARHITPRTTGIIGVHVYGIPCDIEGLQRVADRHGLALMFDAAHAFGCSYRGRMIGNFGRCEIFSFHATKFFNTFEGGAIATNDDELAARIRLMQNFGFQGLDDVACLGTNGKMTEVCAAMGLTNLESAEHFISINRRNQELYRASLKAVRGVELMHLPEREASNCQYVVARVTEAAEVSRDAILEALVAAGVKARRYFYPGCHRMEPYVHNNRLRRNTLQYTERSSSEVIILPTGTAMQPQQITMVTALIRGCIP